MSWFTSIDRYCERTDPSFWSEPVNALTNVAFLAAAYAAHREWKRSKPRDPAILALIAVAFLIGLGSFLFHTFATRAAALADTIPIIVFIYGYFYVALRRFLGLRPVAASAWLLAFVALVQVSGFALPSARFGSLSNYLPALAAMLATGFLARGQRAGQGLLRAAAIFAIALVFRTVDHAVCDAFPLGTHFIWHMLNAVAIYVLLRTAIAAQRS